MAAYRQLLAENHVEEILQDVKQNKNLSRKNELPVWLPLAASFNNGTRKAEDAVPSGLYFLDIDEKGLTEQLWKKVHDENLIEAFRIVYFAESAGGGTHIWAWRTPGLSIEENIQRLASRLGVGYDSHGGKDPSGPSCRLSCRRCCRRGCHPASQRHHAEHHDYES